MTSIPITLATAGILGLLYVVLSFNVTKVRIDTKTISGDGAGTPAGARLQLAQRIQVNFIEYVPLALLLIGGIEEAGANRDLVLGLAGALLLARFAHPFGMTRKAPNPARAGGAMLTWAVLTVASVTAIFLAAQALR
jgi:uncharacterized membrane protein YecN with MAPEG domain